MRSKKLKFSPLNLLKKELLLIYAIFMFCLRRKSIPKGSDYFSVYKPVLTNWLFIFGLAVVEIFGVAFIPFSENVHKILIFLGGWTLLIVMGIISALITYPIFIQGSNLVLRNGFWSLIKIPIMEISSVSLINGYCESGLKLVADKATLSPSNETNIKLNLNHDLEFSNFKIRTVDFWVDNPSRLLGQIQQLKA